MRHARFHGLQAEKREVRMPVDESAADGFGKQIWLVSSTQNDGHGGLGVVCFGEVEVRNGWAGEVEVVDVAHDADHGGPRLNFAAPNTLPNRILTGPLLRRERAIDDNHVVAAAVVGSEVTAAEEGLADGGEITRGYVEVVRPMFVVMVALIGMRVTAEAGAIDGAADRRMVGRCDRPHPGHTAKGFDCLIEEESGARSIVAGRNTAAVDIDASDKQM